MKHRFSYTQYILHCVFTASLLAVVVVSCVLGGILLILLLAKLIYHYWYGCFCQGLFLSETNETVTVDLDSRKYIIFVYKRSQLNQTSFSCLKEMYLMLVTYETIDVCSNFFVNVVLLLCRRRSNGKSDYSSSPYSSDKQNQPWPEGVTSIPRATTHWDAPSNIEMTEGGSTRALVNKKDQSNGLVSSH